MSIASTQTIQLYLTDSDQCSYLDDRQQRMLLVDPNKQLNNSLATYFSNHGFRRSGNMTYRPKCDNCKQCISVRVPVIHFSASKSQRRIIKKNSQVSVTLEPLSNALDYFDIYYEYQKSRHPGGSMCDSSEEKYLSFIQSDYCDSALLVRKLEETVISVTVVDLFNDGASLLYTFFDPKHDSLSPGTAAIIDSISYCIQQGIPYVYLGFWIQDSNKMNYKTNFQPLEGYFDGEWKMM
jgi:arginine-tRNA-protein transferase